VPFVTRSALFCLSKLSVWWLRLGIGIERIEPGNPQQNSRHEQMHFHGLTELTYPLHDRTITVTCCGPTCTVHLR